MATGQYIDPMRLSKKPLGIKAVKKHHVITFNPSTANPGETLYVRIPKLTKNTFYVPKSFYLSADVNISGTDGHDNHVVNNLGKNLISQLSVKWGSETVTCLNHYDLYMTYKDLWLPKEKRNNMIFEGIQDVNVNKLRSGLTVGGASGNDNIMNTVFGPKYKIPLDFELLNDHSPLYKYVIDEDIIFEITLNQNNYVLKSSKAKDWAYKLTNICLEYETVTSSSIASTIAQQYNSGYSILFDKVDYFKTVKVAANETLINENINFPRSSIKGVLLLFVKRDDIGTRESENFHNPEIKDVEITIEGISSQLYNNGLRMLDQWHEAKKFFMTNSIKNDEDCFMTIEKYYGAGHGYGLWIDFRSTHDNTLHGSGTKLQNTKDGIQLSFKKKTGEGPFQMHIFIVSDAQINIANYQLHSIQY